MNSFNPKKITGSVQKKNGKWYLAINLYDGNKRTPKWINTNLELRGNKKRAEALLDEELEKYNNLKDASVSFLQKRETLLLADYAKIWLEKQKKRVRATTYSNDAITVTVHIIPYFAEKNLLVKDITEDMINTYFVDKRNGYGGRKPLSSTSLQRHHATLTSILKAAIKDGFLDELDLEEIRKPPSDTKQIRWYNQKRMQELINLLREQNSKLLLPVLLVSYFSLRREEVCGLREDAIDFENHIFYVEHVVSTCYLYDEETGVYKTTQVQSDLLKNMTSRRAFPMFPELEECMKEQIKKNRMFRRIYGNAYNEENIGYLLLHENGNRIGPDYITHTFTKFISKNKLPKITFHGLRHSSASLMLELGFSMKEVQEWLGHASYTTTERIYAHVDSQRKLDMAHRISEKITFKMQPETAIKTK